jgi:hypothetical protein
MSQLRRRIYHYGTILMAASMLVIGVINTGCTKACIDISLPDEALSVAGIEDIFPDNLAQSVEINACLAQFSLTLAEKERADR